MKIHRYILVFFILIFAWVKIASANTGNKKSSVILCGKISGNDLDKKRRIEIVVVNSYSLPVTARNFDTKSFEARIIGDSFYIEIPCQAKVQYMQFREFDDKLINNKGDLYLFQSGDSIHFSLNGKMQCNITGNGANDILCQLELDKVYALATPFSNDKSISNQFEFAKMAMDELIMSGLKIIERYKPNVNGNIYEILKLNFICRAKLKLINSYNLKYIFDSQDYLRKGILYFYKLYKEQLNVDSSIWMYSSNFLHYQHSKDWLYLRAKSILDYKLDTAFVLMLRSIKSKYKAVLGDRLIAFHFIKTLRDYGTAIQFVGESLKYVSDLYSKKLLLNLQIMQPGVKAQEIDFVDSTGRRYTLNDFAGKTTIFHLWFLGCHGCLDLKREMESVTKYLRNDSDVVFVSVNADVDRSRWIKGINQKKYSSDLDINLFANGLGINHPFLKYYQFSAFPQMFIIDKKGIIISANPPRPDGEQNIRIFLSLIGKMGEGNDKLEETISRNSE